MQQIDQNNDSLCICLCFWSILIDIKKKHHPLDEFEFRNDLILFLSHHHCENMQIFLVFSQADQGNMSFLMRTAATNKWAV